LDLHRESGSFWLLRYQFPGTVHAIADITYRGAWKKYIKLRLMSTWSAVFAGIPWQGCQFHLQQNAIANVHRPLMLSVVAADIRAIFNAPDRESAETFLKKAVQKYEKYASKTALWLEENIPEGLTVFAFPASHRRMIRTTNGLERISREVHRRTRVVGIFPNEAACLRLVSAILMEIDDVWQTGRVYLTFEKEDLLALCECY
jgi:putative transposase